MAEAEFNYNSRQNITKMRTERLKERIRRLTGQDKKIAEARVKSGGRYCNTTDPGIREVVELFYQDPGMRPSGWFGKRGPGPTAGCWTLLCPGKCRRAFCILWIS